VLQCSAVCCSVVQCVAVCCSVLQCVADIHTHSASWVLHCVADYIHTFTVCYSVLPCVAVSCSVLQCVVVPCSALQCVAVRCSALQCVTVCCRCVAVCCRHTNTQFILKYEQPTRKRCVFYNTKQSTLNATDFCSQHTATHCNTLQHTATHCNVLLLIFVERKFPSCVCCLFIELGATHVYAANTQLHTATYRDTYVRLLPLYLVPLSPPRQPPSLPCSIQRLLMVCAIDPGINVVALEEQQLTSLLRLVLRIILPCCTWSRPPPHGRARAPGS